MDNSGPAHATVFSMTTISGPRAPVTVSKTQSTSSASTAQPAAPSQATGYASSSAFQTAAAAPTSSPPRALTDAKAQLDRFPAGADRDAVALVLNKAWPTPKELEAARTALNKLAENAPEGMSEDDFKKLSNGLSYKSNQNTMMSMVTSNMQKMIDEIKKRGEKKD
jgi:hypothetical protein